MFNFETTFLDYPSADGLAVIIYLNGCSHKCPFCHNENMQKGHNILTEAENKEVVDKLKDLCLRNQTNKIVISGGDCLYKDNIDTTRYILDKMGKDYDITLYTGYPIEFVKVNKITGFKFVKCGTFNNNDKQASEKTDEYIQFVNKTQNLFDGNYNQLSENGRYYFN